MRPWSFKAHNVWRSWWLFIFCISYVGGFLSKWNKSKRLILLLLVPYRKIKRNERADSFIRRVPNHFLPLKSLVHGVGQQFRARMSRAQAKILQLIPSSSWSWFWRAELELHETQLGSGRLQPYVELCPKSWLLKWGCSHAYVLCITLVPRALGNAGLCFTILSQS